MSTPTYSHDLRAPSVAQKRFRTRQEKYHCFQHIHPGALGQPHLELGIPGSSLNQLPHWEAPVVNWTPRILYEEAQCWPRPPKLHHASRDKVSKRGRTDKWDRRRERKRHVRREMTYWGTEVWEKEFEEWRADVEVERELENYDLWYEKSERALREALEEGTGPLYWGNVSKAVWVEEQRWWNGEWPPYMPDEDGRQGDAESCFLGGEEDDWTDDGWSVVAADSDDDLVLVE